MGSPWRESTWIVELWLTSIITFNISEEKTMKGLMVALKKLYENPWTSNKVFHMKQKYNLQMIENGFVTTHLNDFNSLVNQLASINMRIEEESKVVLLCSLPQSWESLAMVNSNYFITRILSFNDVVSNVLSHGMQRKNAIE